MASHLTDDEVATNATEHWQPSPSGPCVEGAYLTDAAATPGPQGESFTLI
jgi:hypothetical protein